MNKSILFFLLLAIICPPTFAATNIDRIAAIVNKEIITQRQLDTEMINTKLRMQQMNVPIPSDPELRTDVLNQLINRSLQMQLVKNRNIHPSDQEINKAIHNIASQNHLTVDQLKETIGKEGMSYSEFRKHIQEQIAMQMLQQQEIARNISIADQDIEDFIRKHRNFSTENSSYHVLDMLIPLPDNPTSAQLNDTLQQAQTALTHLRQGEEAQQQITINDLGWRRLSELPPLFSDKIKIMKVGSFVGPLQANNGFHILKLVETNGTSIKLTKEDAQRIVFQNKFKEELENWLHLMRDSAYVKIMD